MDAVTHTNLTITLYKVPGFECLHINVISVAQFCMRHRCASVEQWLALDIVSCCRCEPLHKSGEPCVPRKPFSGGGCNAVCVGCFRKTNPVGAQDDRFCFRPGVQSKTLAHRCGECMPFVGAGRVECSVRCQSDMKYCDSV